MNSTDELLQNLQVAIRPTVSIAQVTAWVRTGRKRPRFHVLAWLSRTVRRSVN